MNRWLMAGIITLVLSCALTTHAESPTNSSAKTVRAPARRAADSDFDQLRIRWQDSLSGGARLNPADSTVASKLASLTASAQALWVQLNKLSGRTCLWNDLAQLTNDSGQIWHTYQRLETLSLAFATPGSGLYNNNALQVDLLSALDWMQANIYNQTKIEYGNWWFWEIGIPLCLDDITVLLYDSLSHDQIIAYMSAVNKFTPVPSGTAANLVWKATVVAVRGALVKDPAKIQLAATSLSQVFPYVSHGDGFYRDGSFVQHLYYPYTGSYGSSLIGCLAKLLGALNGSPWQVTDPQMTNVFQWIFHAYQPLMSDGAMMDMVRGRAISRSGETDQRIGEEMTEAVIHLAACAPPATNAALKQLAKSWLQTASPNHRATHASLGILPLEQSILADSTIIPARPLLGHFQFSAMDRVVHRRAGSALGLSLSSSRIANYESINSENLHGWYTGEGMTYLYNADQEQFGDSFWPTINPYRLPGTTVNTEPRADSSGAGNRSRCQWVGGAALAEWGAAGMQLEAWHSNLTAKKSWFMFDDEIVCLGAGITSADDHSIETIIENRKLSAAATNSFVVNGTGKPPVLGWTETLTKVTWCHLAGNVAGADIGYYFPQPEMIRGLREPRTGSWTNINKYEPVSQQQLTRNYLTLWLDHGLKPTNQTYAYFLLPGKSATATASYAASPQVEVLTNRDSLQAVKNKSLGLTMANFWTDSLQTVDGITSDRKASIVLQVNSTNLLLSVADPTQVNTNGINVTIDRGVVSPLTLDKEISILQLRPTLKLHVNTTGAAGKSLLASFNLGTK